MSNGDMNNGSNPIGLWVYFSNMKTAPLTVTCTLRTSYQGSETAYAVTKSVIIEPRPQQLPRTGESVLDRGRQPREKPATWAASLVGIDCTLPVGAVINDTYLDWPMDNGIEPL